MTEMAETQRRLRGHDFLPPPGERRRIPGERATEHVPLAEKVIHVHYSCASADWWIAEIWREDGRWLAFDYAQFASMPECAEWGLIPLDELEETRVNVGPLTIIVERDLDWTPVPFWRTRAEATLSAAIGQLRDEEEAAAALDALPLNAKADDLTEESTALARAMILKRFPGADRTSSPAPPAGPSAPATRDEPAGASPPSADELQEWLAEGGCETPDGCWVEPDGTCPHGQQSWLLKLGMI
jgi:hypothetical protein